MLARTVRDLADPVRLSALASRIDHIDSSVAKRMNRVCDTNLRGRIMKSIRSVGCVAGIPAHPRPHAFHQFCPCVISPRRVFPALGSGVG